MAEQRSTHEGSILRFGASVSVTQSALFFVMGAAALALGVDRLLDLGFSGLPSENLTAFRVLCLAFVAIAVLGLAITPAEQQSIEHVNAALARFGAALAYVGHAGTIAYFSWWLLRTLDAEGQRTDVDELAPLEWGVMFELVLVGAWVWIIAGLAYTDPRWPRWFVALSVVKAVAFWFAFAAFLAESAWMLVVGLGAVTFAAGPAWHLARARLFRQWAPTAEVGR